MDTDGFRKALLDQGEVRQEVDRQQDRRQPPHSIGHDRQSLPPQLDRGLRRPPVRRHPVRVLQIQGRDIVELFRGFIELLALDSLRGPVRRQGIPLYLWRNGLGSLRREGHQLCASRLLLLIIPVSFQPCPKSGAFSHQSAWYCGIILLHQKDRRTKGESDIDVRV